MELIRIVEALLFSYQEPLSVEHMVRAIRENAKDIVESGDDDAEAAKPLAEVTEEQVMAAVQQLIHHYEKEGHSFTIAERSNGWRLCAQVQYADWCRSLYPGKKPQRLSQPALETLAIIAYRQPITKAGIEAVRGVSVDAMVQQLVDRGLVKIEGRAELPGKPLLYGTTEAFLEHFAIRSVEELPNAQELRRVELPSEPAQPASPEPKEVQLTLSPA
ncbi:MAG: SMC-Scp complex subunit ScpB [Verrucomicrobiaceae bacterium]|nr:SMC-Scp complex subunit ScpB [Verrucomicrobiaceae bacterium]